MARTVSDVIVDALKRHGVEAIFGQSIPSAVLLSAERAGIRHVMYRTENAGGAMADGYARATNRLGVVAAQNGPAATLLVPPLTEAMLVSVPVLALVQDVATPTQDRNAFQELDHFALFTACSKWTRRLTDPLRADEYVERAISNAMSGRPGPAVLLLPKDVLITEVPSGRPSRTTSFSHTPVDRPTPARAALTSAARLLADARRPVVLAGGGVHRSHAANALALLQEKASLPVGTTNMGKGAVSELHPLSLGVVGNAMGDRSPARFTRDLVTEADVVLLVGTRTNENGTDGWTAYPEHATYIHLDLDGTEIGRNYEALRLVGDARAGLEGLLQELGSLDLSQRQRARPDVEARISAARADAAALLAERVRLDATPIRPELVIHELETLLDADAVLVADASYSTLWVSLYATAKAVGQRFLYPRGMAGLGWGLPMAMGAQVARPEATVACITGDGGFGHVWSELEAAVREQLPVVVVLLNNGTLGFQTHSELVQFGEHTGAVDFRPVDHAAIARACGADGVTVTHPAQLRDALARAIANRRPTLVEVMTDPDAYPPIKAWEARAHVLPG
jgi:acetolactate synthase-1/2/3 large subunit